MVDYGSDISPANFNTQGYLVRDLINCLHIGQGNMRVGYVPYSSELLQCFGLEDHDSREELIKAIGEFKRLAILGHPLLGILLTQ